jgi:ribosomal protein S18 acetylase RimI-like enzyme
VVRIVTRRKPARRKRMVAPRHAIRPATRADLTALVALENATFESDRLARRNFQWMLSRANSALLVATVEGVLVGYILVLFNDGTSLARIYSIALDRSFQGLGLGDALVAAAEQAALDEDRAYMRLEVRPDNRPAIRLYERHGYRHFGRYRDYYEDHADALRYEKRILVVPEDVHRELPHYRQTSEFTCGPAALMMAMKGLRPDTALDEALEFQLWREATTIFMTSGHGGCGPRGLALAAWRRGFRVELFTNHEGAVFTSGVRDENKKRVIEIVHRDFVRQLQKTDVSLRLGRATLADLRGVLERGGVPLVLISHYLFSRTKSPHWVAVTTIDDTFVYVHDPLVDVDEDKTVTDSMYVPVRHTAFLRMWRYGQVNLRTAVAISERTGKRGKRPRQRVARTLRSDRPSHARGSR